LIFSFLILRQTASHLNHILCGLISLAAHRVIARAAHFFQRLNWECQCISFCCDGSWHRPSSSFFPTKYVRLRKNALLAGWVTYVYVFIEFTLIG